MPMPETLPPCPNPARRGRRRWLPTAALLATLAGTSSAEAATWELISPFPPDDFQTRNLEQFAADVRQASAGALTIVVLPDPARFSSASIRDTVASGRMPAGEVMLSELGREGAAFQVDAVPFLAGTYDQALALWEASRPVLEPRLEAAGLKLAFVVPRPPRSLFVDKQIWSMQDLHGLRIRDDGPMTQRLAVLAGAVPVAATPGPVAQAFAGNTLDAFVDSIPGGVAQSAWAVVPYVYDLRISLPKSAVVYNAGAYQALDPEVQRALLNAAVAAQNRGWQASGAAHNDGIDLLRARGMTVAAPEPGVTAGLNAIGAQMTEEWARTAGLDGQTILSGYRARRP